MSDIDARLAAASSFILQSPPGEVNDVFNDVRALVGDDEALESGILPALEKYNIRQFVVADTPEKGQLLICEAGLVPAGTVTSGSSTTPQSRFIDPSTGQSWAFDHLRLSASDPVHVHVDESCEAIRIPLEQAAAQYAKEHFAEGVSKVFTTEQRQLKRPRPIKEEKQETTAATDVSAGAHAAMVPSSEGAVVGGENENIPEVSTEEAASASQAQEDSEMTSASAAATPAPDADVEVVEGDAESMKPTTAMEADVPSNPAVHEEPTIGEAEAAITAPELEPEEVVEPVSKKFSLYFVGNKYNPSNYWTGRWRSEYSLDLSSSSEASLTGRISIHVHFFEQGNVQLSTTHTPTLALPSSVTAQSSPEEIAKSILKVISKAEEEYQLELNDAYREMAEKTFRGLRRALPLTRQKMDWNRVANYKLGRDLGGPAGQ